MIPRLLSLSCLCVAAACDSKISPAREAPQNLVIVVLDTLRPDHLGHHGAARDTSPRLDRLARESVVFENALSAAPLTSASLISLMTSLYPEVHGIQGAENPGRMAEGVTTLAEILKARGYATAAFTEGGYAKGDFGLDQGFDVYPPNPGDAESNFSNLRYPSRLAGNLDRTLEWLRTQRKDPFFLFFHTYEIHSPYRTREEYVRMFRPYFDEKHDHARVIEAITRWNRERKATREDCLALLAHIYQCSLDGLPSLEAPDAFEAVARGFGLGPDDAVRAQPILELVRDLYDASIRYTDHELERLWNALDELDLSRNTIVVVASDHGEGLGEHGEMEHGNVLFEEALRVELLIHVPGSAFAPRRVPSLVRTIDVMPTALELMDVAPKGAFLQGESLLPLMHGEESSRVAFSHARRIAPGQNPQYSVKSGRWRQIVEPATDRLWLYDLVSDPGEHSDVAAANPDVVERLSGLLERQSEQDRRLRSILVATPRPIELDQATIDELRALGYIGASGEGDAGTAKRER